MYFPQYFRHSRNLLERLPECLPREVQMGPNGPRRELQSLRDLSVFPSFEIVQQHDLSLYFRELRERPFEQAPQLPRFRHPIRCRRTGPCSRRDLLGLPERLTADEVLGAVPNDRHQPSGEPIGAPAFIEPIQRYEKRFLCRILRVFVSSDDR
ncbi:MAG: hypothetical protein AMS19_12030 [Gemmatimonas sp. SG8_23]|nr:MAG: hypothetical protein AMS19_12030 [Gemmatimonas sp. SG8_23]